MLISTGIPKIFLAKALHIIWYYINKSPFTALEFKSPTDVSIEKVVAYEALSVFDYMAYIHQRMDK